MPLPLLHLQNFLDQNDIPAIKGKPKTFLGIARQPHYENVLSNIYAFFFSEKEEHGLKDLFLNSLCQLIRNTNSHKEPQDFADLIVETEYTTQKGGRIDLLLYNEQQAIIIENKVYHQLNNDLQDYWTTVKVPEANKQGIILSLHHVSDISHPSFVNITHLELLNRVMANIGPYLLEASNKYLIYLKDLYQNTINLSKSYMTEKDLKFYFDNQKEIHQLANFKFSVRDHIISETEKAGQALDNLNLLAPRASSFNAHRLRYYVSPTNRELMITVVFENLLTTEMSMYIAVELIDDLLKDKTQYDAITFTVQEKAYLKGDFKSSKENWAHFAMKHYHPSVDEVENLAQFILKKLEEDHLLNIYKKVNNYLGQTKVVAV